MRVRLSVCAFGSCIEWGSGGRLAPRITGYAHGVRVRVNSLGVHPGPHGASRAYTGPTRGAHTES